MNVFTSEGISHQLMLEKVMVNGARELVNGMANGLMVPQVDGRPLISRNLPGNIYFYLEILRCR